MYTVFTKFIRILYFAELCNVMILRSKNAAPELSHYIVEGLPSSSPLANIESRHCCRRVCIPAHRRRRPQRRASRLRGRRRGADSLAGFCSDKGFLKRTINISN